MNRKLDALTETDIEKIRQLVEILDKSTFETLSLELDDIKLTIGTGTSAPTVTPAAAVVAPAAPTSPESAAAIATNLPAAVEGLIDVTAPTMGHFYARPDPNSAPYVTIGASVDAESTVGLLEVMKLFNSVTAGTAGTVEQICVVDAELVEYGQVLMRIRPLE